MNKQTRLLRLVPLVCLLILSFSNIKAQEKGRFTYGGGVSVAISDYLDIDVSPRVGYNLTPDFTIGLLAKYEYINDRRSGVEPYKANTYGGGAYAQYNVSSLFSKASLPFNIHAHTEYQYLYTEINRKNYSHTTYDTRDRWFVGIGFSVPFGVKSSFYTTIMYDILAEIKNKGDEYSNKPVISVGIQF